MIGKKPVEFLGSSREDLRDISKGPRQALGEQLMRVQLGAMPADYKAMPTVGKGVYEIRVHVEGAWRMMYVAKFDRAIYVLHVFQKKTQQTALADIAIAKSRYRTIGD